ncbi:heterokaryon incompatibility protein-domain-containing protein [Lasiosphaeris hirsuta]|uniref:Heterokaryon incompatibility protein-domain-containing protein n=1 Tax=Lasiosphaeris hirsuta TaxID=260670 RepID=A0AA40ANY2_9PEZI|nr:heterokaryon incompatibility protein-domain-containing protein [Lasiosphaeris hirsuta]
MPCMVDRRAPSPALAKLLRRRSREPRQASTVSCYPAGLHGRAEMPNGSKTPACPTRPADQLDDATIFGLLSPSGFFFSADLFRSSLRLEPTYCPPCRQFLLHPAPMFRQWWVNVEAGGMRMPNQWHEIHSMKDLQVCATRISDSPDGKDIRCPLCTMIWEQATQAAVTNPIEMVVRDHPNANVRLSLVETFRQPANNMLYQTQKIFIDFGFPRQRASWIPDYSIGSRMGQLNPAGNLPESEWPSATETGFLRLLLLSKPHVPYDTLFPGSSTSSDASYELVRYWMGNCHANDKGAHNFCIEAVTKAAKLPLPTRLIDVSAQPTSVQLVLSSSLDSSIEYVALSHCWGKLEFIKLKSTNIASFQAGIPLSQLPRTFKDAVDVTRKLGFRYLWIDSLCIIQDLTADWQAEAGRMADVYLKAVLTLAAAASTDANSGLFTTRKPLPRHIVLDDQADPADPDPITIVQPDWDEHFLSIIGGNLQTRGWTFQERALSTRILHYGDGALAWECATLSSSELCQGKMPRCGDIYSLSSLKVIWDPTKPALNDPTDERYVMRPPDVFAQWFGFVEEYSNRSLTITSDKLIAISAMAKVLRMQLKEHLDYLSGLWGESWFMLCVGWVSRVSYEKHNLVMEEHPTDSHTADTQTYVAPSWSWASLDGPVIYPFRDLDALYEVPKVTLPAQITRHHLEHPSGDDTMSVERGASVTILGLTWHAFLASAPLEERPVSNLGAWHRDLFFPFWTLRGRDDGRRLLDRPADIVLDRPPRISDNNTTQTSPRPVTCLFTALYQEECPVTTLVKDHRKNTAQLLLIEECEENKRRYRRVGVAFVVSVPDDFDWFRNMGGSWEEVTII